jgi:hypothetical protein
MTKKVDYYLPIVVSILYFLALKQVITATVYLVTVVPIAVYFFPVRILWESKSYNESGMKKKLLLISSNFLFALILSLSIFNIYIQKNDNVNLILTILAVVNLLAAIYYFLNEKSNNTFVTHLCFTFLTGAIFFI